jgi:hypothetical protein
MKSRLGKADSIFKSTKADKAAAGKVMDALIRPAAGTSVENKLTVILPPGQVDFLDRLALEIRTKTKAKVKRTEIIRALIAGLMRSGMDLSTFGTEEDIAAAIQERLKG